MQKRTFLRTMLDILFNNTFTKSVKYFVNFCYEQRLYAGHGLKFLKNMPINSIIEEERYSNKLLFSVSEQQNTGLKQKC